MLCRHSDKQRPKARSETHEHANKVHARGTTIALKEKQDNTYDGEGIEDIEGCLARAEPMADKPNEHIAEGDGYICQHDGLARVYSAGDMELFTKLFGEGNQDTYDVPCRQANQYGNDVPAETAGIGEEHEEIALCHPRLLDGCVHTRFEHANAHEQEQQAEPTTDEITNTPIVAARYEVCCPLIALLAEPLERVCYEVGHDCTCEPYACNNGCSLAANMGGDELANEGDACAELASQTNAGNEPSQRILIDSVHKAICDIGNGIQNNGSEEDAKPTLLIAHHAPKYATNEEAVHLDADDEFTFGVDEGIGKAKATEALDANDAEQQQVVNIYKIAQCCYEHGNTEKSYLLVLAHG